MATKGYDVSKLADYVKVNEDVILKDVIFGDAEKGDTISKCRKQLGVKTKERLNFLDVTPTLQDGSACGFSAKGSTVFTDRDVVTKVVKVNDEYCSLDLLGKYSENLVNLNADGEPMPYESVIVDEIVKGIQKQSEKIVWQGDDTLGIDGFLELADNGGADSASTINVAIASGTSIYDAVKQVYMEMPEELLDNGFIGLSPANFRKFTQELVEKNLYHYPSAQNENAKSFILPGTDVEVKAIEGLKGVNNKIYASTYENMVYATDALSDAETTKAWYDPNTELFRISIRWNMGVAVLYPDHVVLGTIAS